MVEDSKLNGSEVPIIAQINKEKAKTATGYTTFVC